MSFFIVLMPLLSAVQGADRCYLHLPFLGAGAAPTVGGNKWARFYANLTNAHVHRDKQVAISAAAAAGRVQRRGCNLSYLKAAGGCWRSGRRSHSQTWSHQTRLNRRHWTFKAWTRVLQLTMYAPSREKARNHLQLAPRTLQRADHPPEVAEQGPGVTGVQAEEPAASLSAVSIF